MTRIDPTQAQPLAPLNQPPGKLGSPVPPPIFEPHFEQAAHALQSALIELLAAVSADAERPQEISRRFGINKNLAWKLARIANEGRPVAWAPQVPGRSGLRIALDALCPTDDLTGLRQAVEEAYEGFENMVNIHAGDRATLELMLNSTSPDEIQSERLETSRRLSFQGNSATWGVRTKVRFGFQFDAPSRTDSETIDLAVGGGVLGLRRLRQTGSWPLLRISTFGGSAANFEPVDDRGFNAGDAPLMHDFCSKDIPEIRNIPIDQGELIELGEGPVGNAHEVSCAYGKVIRNFASIYADEEGEVGEHHMRMDGPVERVQFDMFVHRDLPVELPPHPVLYSLMQGQVSFPVAHAPQFHLPCPATVRDLGSARPMIATPNVPHYGRILDQVCKKLDRKLEEFRGYRIEMTYPPIPTILCLYFPLPVR